MRRPPWTRRQRVIAAVFAAAVAAQFVVPAVVLTSEPKRGVAYRHRFGWQMFTHTRVDLQYGATTADRTMRRIDVPDEVGAVWGYVHYGSGTPKRLCAADPRRVKVTRYVLTESGERRAEVSFSCH